MRRPTLQQLKHVATRGGMLFQNSGGRGFRLAAVLSSALESQEIFPENKTLPSTKTGSLVWIHCHPPPLSFSGNLNFSSSPSQGRSLRPRRAPVTTDSAMLQVLTKFHSSAGQRRAVPAESVPDPDAEAEQRSPPTERVLRLVDEISDLTLLEVSDLTTLLKKKLGMPDVPMMGMMPMQTMPAGTQAPGSAPAADEAAEPEVVEKTSFDVKLEKFDAASKLKVIKEVRAMTGLGLKESKELVEGAPAVLKKGITKDEAEAIVEKLKAVGAEVVLE